MLALESNTRITAHDIDNDPEIFIEPESKHFFKVRFGMGEHLINNLFTSQGFFIKLKVIQSELGIVGDIVEVMSIRDGRMGIN